MRENTIYSGQQISPMKSTTAWMRKLARISVYNSRVLRIKLPPFKLQGTSEHVYIEVEIL